jgi:hypothetical protein
LEVGGKVDKEPEKVSPTVGEGEDRARGQLYITARVVSCVLQTWKSFVHIYLPRTGIFREGKNEDTGGSLE